jgi:hypothetical protein
MSSAADCGSGGASRTAPAVTEAQTACMYTTEDDATSTEEEDATSSGMHHRE